MDWTLHLHSRLRRSQLLAERMDRIDHIASTKPLVAETRYQHTLELSRQHLGDDAAVTLDIAFSLGTLQLFLGRYAGVIETLDTFIPRYDPARHRKSLFASRAVRADARSGLGEHEPAMRDLHTIVDEARSIWGDDGWATLYTRRHLASVLADAGQIDEALAHITDLVAIRTRVYGPDDRVTLCARHLFGQILVMADEVDRAEAEFAAAANDTAAGRACNLICDHGRAQIAAARGQRDEAVRGYQAVITGWTDYLGPETVRAQDARDDLAKLTG
jgi:tetratricopeptide (TPR) repeat protein